MEPDASRPRSGEPSTPHPTPAAGSMTCTGGDEHEARAGPDSNKAPVAAAVLLPLVSSRIAAAQDERGAAKGRPEWRSLAYQATVDPGVPLRVAMERLPNRREWTRYCDSHPNQHVSIDKRTGRPFRVDGIDRSLELSPRAPREEFEKFGLEFVRSHNGILRIPDSITFRLRPGHVGLSDSALSKPSTASNRYRAVFDGYVGNVPILGARLIFKFSNGVSEGFSMTALGDEIPELHPRISVAEAMKAIERHVGHALAPREKKSQISL